MIITNKNGRGLLAFLITLIILCILFKLMLPSVKQTAQTQTQMKQTVENVRAQLKQAEKAAQQRANFGQGF